MSKVQIPVDVRREIDAIFRREGSLALGDIVDDRRASLVWRIAAQEKLDAENYDGDCDRWG